LEIQMSTYDRIRAELDAISYSSSDGINEVSYRSKIYSTSAGIDSFVQNTTKLVISAITNGVYDTLAEIASNLNGTIIPSIGTLSGAPATLPITTSWNYFPKEYFNIKIEQLFINPAKIQLLGFESCYLDEFILLINSSIINASFPSIGSTVVLFPAAPVAKTAIGLLKSNVSSTLVETNDDQKTVNDKYIKGLADSIDIALNGNIIPPMPISNSAGYIGTTSPSTMLI
jgi:hypothetical protein